MFFDDWQTNEKYKDSHISLSLLWEYNLNNFDWNYMRRVVVQRVIERGNMRDFYAAIRLYGGLENFINIIKNEVISLSDRDIAFVCSVFGLDKKELLCYTRKQSREKLLLS